MLLQHRKGQKQHRRLSLNKVIICLFSVFLTFYTYSIEVPQLHNFVNDYADMIDSKTEQIINSTLKSLEDTDSTQIYILTIPSLEGGDIESFSLKTAEKWGIGQKDKDNGLLFVVSMNDRKMRIEVGYGLEGVITDLLAGRIIDNIAAPAFKTGDYNSGFLSVTDALVSAAKGEYKNDRSLSNYTSKSNKMEKSFGIFIALFIIIKLIGSVSNKAGAVSGVVLGGLAPVLAGIFNPFVILVSIIAGLTFSFIPLSVLFYMLAISSGRGSSGSSGGGFSGGGGGGFGGGGSSGGW